LRRHSFTRHGFPQRIKGQIGGAVAEKETEKHFRNDAAADGAQLRSPRRTAAQHRNLHLHAMMRSLGQDVGPQGAIVGEDAAIASLRGDGIDDRSDDIASRRAVDRLADDDLTVGQRNDRHSPRD
jgi:hypothetical protein